MNQNNYHIWYNLLDFWCNEKRPKGYGLTIPFLVGATGIIGINELLTEISNTKRKQLVVIQFCHDLWEYVLSLAEETELQESNYKNFGYLLINDENLKKYDSLKQVIEILNKRYEPMILNKNYSKNKFTGEWYSFSNDDIHLIKEITDKKN